VKHRIKSSSGFISIFWTGLKALLNLPIYWISLIVPKKEYLWVFGAWFGERYSDNSKYLFEYVNSHHPEIKAYWLSNSKDVVSLVRSKGYKSLNTKSLKGYLISIKAKYAFLTSSIRDINPYTIGGTQIIQLWHGIPLKKIFFDDAITFGRMPVWEKIMLMIFPFYKKNYDYSKHYFVVNSLKEKEIISSAFNMPKERILITGSPRLDSMVLNKENVPIIQNIRKLKEKKQIVALYAPTHRQQGINRTTFLHEDLERLQHILKSKNINLFINLHFYHKERENEAVFSNIHFMKNTEIEGDIYVVLNEFDVLITDYSSIYFDFLIMDKPIIFYPYDLEEYTKKDRKFYFSYDEVTPGPKVQSLSEMAEMIYKQYHEDLYKRERERIRNTFLNFIDGNNSERLCVEILEGQLG